MSMCKPLFCKVLFAMLIFSTLFVSCSEESKMLDDSVFGYQYYPLEVGKYWIYSSDKIVVDDGGATIVESSKFIKEEITERFIDAAGDSIYRLERSESMSQSGPFLVSDVWTTSSTVDAAFRTEENLDFIKMIFPISVGTTWEGNLFDELIYVNVADESVQVYKDWGDYECTAKGISIQAGGEMFEDVLTIKQGEFNSDIERRYSVVHYASGIGPIKREMDILDTQCSCPGETWLEKAEQGFTLREELVEYN